MDGFFLLFMINSILSSVFFFLQRHLASSMMLTYFSCSMVNSRCEKVAVVKGWLGKVLQIGLKRSFFCS
jgi:hypothetical protein